MGNCILTRRGGGAWVGIPNFTYTGTYETVDDGDGNWRLKFLTSGVFTLLKPKQLLIDVFCVGGGGGGGGAVTNGASSSGGGGGGGYTQTSTSIEIIANAEYQITIGTGGSFGGSITLPGSNDYGTANSGGPGGQTIAFNVSANGGAGGTGGAILRSSGAQLGNGGNGGSGGGGAGSDYGGASGGSNGSNGSGYTGYKSSIGGTGQEITTREFREPDGDLYSGGGSGGCQYSVIPGGNGGGGNGGSQNISATSGTQNFGGGGGGCGAPGLYVSAGSGGSGIAIIRNARETAS